MKKKYNFILIILIISILLPFLTSCRPSPALTLTIPPEEEPAAVTAENSQALPSEPETDREYPEDDAHPDKASAESSAERWGRNSQASVSTAALAITDYPAENSEANDGNAEYQAVPITVITQEVNETRQINDNNGVQIEIPKKVERIAAGTADSAIIGMLGGIDTLVATSGETGTGLFQKVFPQLKSLPKVWQDSSAAGMSENSFQMLLKAKPQVVLAYSTSFSNNQLQGLKQEGITVVTLPGSNGNTESIISPEYRAFEDVMKKVAIIGQVLGDRTQDGGGNAIQKAQEYTGYCREVMKNMKNCFSFDWKSSFDPLASSYGKRKVTAYIEKYRSGNGVSIYGEKNNLLTSSLTLAGIANSRALSSNIGQSSYVEVDLLNFDTLIVGSREVKASQEYTCWGLEGMNSNVKLVCGPMKQAVNPKGCVSWLEPGPEFILEPLWLATVFSPQSNLYGGSNASAYMGSAVKAFYERFYGYRLSPGELEGILEGPAV
ncbi:hypothetical protein CLHUN_32900 [Ruminiclostridium hungatei]|uniref:Periplasmic binding protein n=1 Tax=Ruminiclostridium hungatei TaxID=48256 RepID=A0A1V4SH38_RUMHU|nr:hypothetical protein [Ruminiclostridium hungatei]OPX42806.1 hypothetical protein CLHUN_32900 [Ruminiclostridium hungatei]